MLFLFVYPALSAEKRKVVIPFDFVSKFDHGHCGEMLGEQIWMKLRREPGFITMDSLSDIRDTCAKQRPSHA